MDDSIILVEGLWKRYGLPLPESYYRFKQTLRKLSPRHCAGDDGSGAAAPWVLRDISFSLARGETIGVIGRNGAGKSTLLKVLAGVTPPSRGSAAVRGRVFPMIELNAGMHQELTGRENMYVLGATMGLTRRDMQQKSGAIEAFCELGPWFDRPVRQYSSGMLARLGFGVAVNVEADVLLVDEVLAVGDLAFQRKCYSRFERLRRSGAAIVFVSHNIRQVERMCDRVLFLNHGETVRLGDPDEVCLLYHRMSSDRERDGIRSLLPETATWQGSGELTVASVEILDARGEAVSEIEPLSVLRIRVHYQTRTAIERPIVTIRILTDDMMRVAAFSTGDGHPDAAVHHGSGWFEAWVEPVPLLQGVYSIGLTIKGGDGRIVYIGDNLALFAISYGTKTKNSFGLVHLDARWAFSSPSVGDDRFGQESLTS